MPRTHARFSRRHLLALCTFLVPLAVLALLGQSELQRSGAEAHAALEREARQFLSSAAQAIERQIDLELATAAQESARLLADNGALRTAVAMHANGRFGALLDVVLLDEQFALVWPTPPPASLHLPFARDARSRGADTQVAGALQAADLLLARGELRDAAALLQHLIEQLDAANPPGRTGRRSDSDEAEIQARFRLATVHRKLGELDAARAEFERVSRAARTVRFDPENVAALPLLADTALAELGSTNDRVRVMRAIAESRRDYLADGLLTAVAERLAATVPADDPERSAVDTLLREERQRLQTRTFAAAYDLVLKFGLRMRYLPAPGAPEQVVEADGDARIVSTLSGKPTLLCVRKASEEEAEKWRCARVGLHLDLQVLLDPVLRTTNDAAATFALAIEGPNDVPLVAPPAATPGAFAPPELELRGLRLRAFPADTARFEAQTAAAMRNRTLLVLAVFATAVGGALWLWRSASREAELAALKIDLVSRVSHELKTPLSLIRMYGETIGMGRARDPDQAAQFGSIIARESERLTAMIQRILDFSRQQSGSLAYDAKVVDLGELLRRICDDYTPQLEARGAILVETLPHGVLARCDAIALESAIVNLLENAAKYGPGEDHEIELELSAAGEEAVVEVRDRGRGIPAGETERVFEGFYRASNAGEVRGGGLGLSLVRHFARAHGGEIAARAREGGGTVFRLTLPLATPPGATTRATVSPAVSQAANAANRDRT